MMKVSEYRAKLRELYDWEPYLLENSGLPGPRGNLELMQAVAAEGKTERFFSFLRWTPERAPAGSREEYLAACGAIGLGESAGRGERGLLARMRMIAADPRWRVREGVAMGLQRFGDLDLNGLLQEMRAWTRGGPLQRRAVVAALAEPRLLQKPDAAESVLDIFDRVTASLLEETDRHSSENEALRKALGYGWSVAIAASPKVGRKLFEQWARNDDPDVRWIVRENLKKHRLEVADPKWAAKMRDRFGVKLERPPREEKAPAAKAAPAAKTPVKKAAAKKAAARKPAAKAAAGKSATRKAAPKKAAPKKATPKKAAPKKAAPKKAAPKKAAPKKAAPKKAAPKKAAPKKAAPKKAAPKKAAPKKAAPKKATPKKAAPRKSTTRRAETSGRSAAKKGKSRSGPGKK